MLIAGFYPDETRPVCVRCTKGGFECLGYARNQVWRNTSTAPFPKPDAPDESLMQRDTSSGHIKDATLVTRRVASPPPEMSLVAFQGDFCFSFMFSNFVWRSYGTPWLDEAAAGRLGHLSLDATRALSEANFGRSNHQPDIELKGVVQYGKCLKTLAMELESGIAHGGRDLLVPILVLMMHAASHADQTGAVFHLRGLARLLHICGPEAFQQQPLLNAFEAARATLLAASLYGKQRLFLEEKRWQTLPFALNPASKTPQSQLLDILVAVPGILQDYAALQPPTNSCGDLLYKVESLLADLYRWRWAWQLRSGDQVELDGNNTFQLNGRAAETLGSIGTSRQYGRLRFGKFVLATEIMLYNATLMWLLALLWKMDPVGACERIEASAVAAAPSGAGIKYVSFEPLRRPGASIAVRDPAMEICRTFEWVTRHHSRSKEAAFLYLFPMGMAMSVLEAEPEAKAWATSLLSKSPITANYAQGQNPAGFGFYVTPEALHPDTAKARHQLFSAQDLEDLS
ncbi:Transcriptional regulatory moc3 [Fusarium albosuccineum]|uniref:Transcriptional regulatory moc3 n=1 Tax=Fusarium albosuccineum TaxID=1237068 RepID=A0A8H4LJC6_9HYPO|nr:Transcriptional regulatory moc3 [Fusarium albosuccineum]